MIHTDTAGISAVLEGRTVLVDFFATWCGPCKMMSPILEEFSSEQSDIAVAKVDIDQSRELAERYNITGVPTMILFKNGTEAGRLVGAAPKQKLIAWIEENK